MSNGLAQPAPEPGTVRHRVLGDLGLRRTTMLTALLLTVRLKRSAGDDTETSRRFYRASPAATRLSATTGPMTGLRGIVEDGTLACASRVDIFPVRNRLRPRSVDHDLCSRSNRR